MSAASPSQCRTVRYATLDDLLSDAETLAAGETQTVGAWSYSQILEHIATAMNSYFDGFGFKAPWFARVFIAPLMKNYLLTKPHKPGFKLPEKGRVLLPQGSLSVEDALDKLRSAIQRFNEEMPTHPHPFLGKLTREETVALNLRHAELHMGFVKPRGE